MARLLLTKHLKTFNKIWYLLGVAYLLALIAILPNLLSNYEVNPLLVDGLNEIELGRMRQVPNKISFLFNLNNFTWLILVLILTLIVLTIPLIRKGIRIRDLLLSQLDGRETKRKEMIHQLEVLKSFIRDLYDQAPVGFLSFNDQGVITEINQTQLDWLEYTRQEIIGIKKYGEFFDTPFREGELEGIEAVKKHGSFNNFETHLITKSGKLIPVLVNTKAAYDSERKFLNSRTVIFNFTERKKMEEIIRQKELEANQLGLLKSQFIANVSHEIRTPLNAITGFTQLLQHTDLTKSQAEFVKNIAGSSENLLTIVSDILDFSRLEAGVFRLEPTPFPLREVLFALQQTFQFRAEEKGLTFVLEIDDKVPKAVFGDPTRLTQILNNLIYNAIKFTEHGSVRLKVQVEKQDSRRVHLSFCVIDTGIGIPEEQLEHIFDRFAQVSANSTRKFGGTGLGLTISQQLAELQNGNISVQSTVGQGSVFRLRLPYLRADETVESAFPTLHHPQNPPPKARILIVEDNLFNQRIIELFLDQWGFAHALAADGRAALEMLRQEEFDLVLLDIQMPDMDGYTTATKIREELKLQLPVIAVTAHAFAGEREKCLAHGMNDYLAKPIRETELRQLLHRHLSAPKGSTSVADTEPTPAPIPGFDPGIIRQVSQGDPVRLREMTGIFFKQIQDEITRFDQAMESNLMPEMFRIVHSMKSTVSYMGLQAFLEPDLQELERLVKQAKTDVATIRVMWGEVHGKLEKAQDFIRKRYWE
jgi:PAS domain S-box-containing protein